MQAFFTILRRGFALDLSQQRVEVIKGVAQFGTRVEEQFQGLFMSLVGGRHVRSFVRLVTLGCRSSPCVSRYKCSKTERFCLLR
ncbi:hypothetical protein EMIT0215P_10333 [Pseudomonas serboccidentalis]